MSRFRPHKRDSMLLPEIPFRTDRVSGPNRPTLERRDRKTTSSPRSHHRCQSRPLQFEDDFHRFAFAFLLVLKRDEIKAFNLMYILLETFF